MMKCICTRHETEKKTLSNVCFFPVSKAQTTKMLYLPTMYIYKKMYCLYNANLICVPPPASEDS